MATAQQVLAKAISQLGLTENPPNSNRVPYWDAYAPHWQGSPWCNRFVSWSGWKVGAADQVGVFDYCPYHVNWFKSRNQWLGRTTNPQPGDVVFFADSSGVACHVGFVEKALNASQVQTIEGNTSSDNNANGGRVERRVRNYGTPGSSWYILGFGRPNYDKEEDDLKLTDTLTTPRGQKITVSQALGAAYDLATRKDDPTGRNQNVGIYDHVKWIAKAVTENGEKLDELLED